MADVVRVHEHRDMRAHLAEFSDDAITQACVPAPEQRERVSDGCGRTVQRNVALAAREVGEEAGNLNGDQATPAPS